jgi:hypothetical protein
LLIMDYFGTNLKFKKNIALKLFILITEFWGTHLILCLVAVSTSFCIFPWHPILPPKQEGPGGVAFPSKAICQLSSWSLTVQMNTIFS